MSAFARRIAENIARAIVGGEAQIDLLLSALLSRGHVLIEDVPGTGKTALAKALAQSLDCAFARVQCTPDLLPADVTGSLIFDQRTASFRFEPGPVFTGVLLADELNRATPRTQSALLECMQERQVTVGGQTHPLKEPFFVVATQNPIEVQGTFPLPEAQLDRFLVRLRLGYPDRGQTAQVLARHLRGAAEDALAPVATAAELAHAQAACREVAVSEAVRLYIADLAAFTRAQEGVQLGASTRAALALMRMCQAFAALRGRDFVTPDDVKALAAPVLAHRLIARGAFLRPGAQEEAVQAALAAAPVPAE